MAIRIRIVKGKYVALCDAKSDPVDGDIYFAMAGVNGLITLKYKF